MKGVSEPAHKIALVLREQACEHCSIKCFRESEIRREQVEF